MPHDLLFSASGVFRRDLICSYQIQSKETAYKMHDFCSMIMFNSAVLNGQAFLVNSNGLLIPFFSTKTMSEHYFILVLIRLIKEAFRSDDEEEPIGSSTSSRLTFPFTCLCGVVTL